MKPDIKTIDAYLKTVPPEVRRILEKIRALARAAAPDAEEMISYGMPAFREGRVFLYFAAFKKHVGIYPPLKADEALIEALARHRGPKGNCQFSLSEPMPYPLIRRLIVALRKEHAKPSEKPAAKKK